VRLEGITRGYVGGYVPTRTQSARERGTQGCRDESEWGIDGLEVREELGNGSRVPGQGGADGSAVRINRKVPNASI
jgi:hypothetical protein